MIRAVRASSAAVVLSMLVVMGCQGGEEIDRESTEQTLGTPTATPPRGRPDPAKMFARADKNADGVLTEGELPARMWEHLRLADQNADGALTQAELQAARESGRLRPPPGFGHRPRTTDGMLEHLDANHDGTLALSELPERMRQRLADSDADSNGVLDRSELEAHLAERALHARARREFGVEHR